MTFEPVEFEHRLEPWGTPLSSRSGLFVVDLLGIGIGMGMGIGKGMGRE